MNRPLLPLLLGALWLGAAPLRAAELPIFDAHVHYSHDAVELTPPRQGGRGILRKAGLKRALVSSSGDDGTQQAAGRGAGPDRALAAPLPHARRDRQLGARRQRRRLPGRAAARTPAMRRSASSTSTAPMPNCRCRGAWWQLARQHGLVLHAHSDADAVERLFQQDPQARILWAHSGFDRPEKVAEMLRKHKNLWCDLAFRSEHGGGGKVPAEWRALFTEFPDRFMVGTDTFTPERWHYVVEHAQLDARLAGRPAGAAGRTPSPGATARRCSRTGSPPRHEGTQANWRHRATLAGRRAGRGLVRCGGGGAGLRRGAGRRCAAAGWRGLADLLGTGRADTDPGRQALRAGHRAVPTRRPGTAGRRCASMRRCPSTATA